MTFVSRIKSNPVLKRLTLRLLMPVNESRPRLWVRLLLNPFYHKKGRRSVIRKRVRLDVFPFNDFVLGARSIIEDFATVNNGVGAVRIGDNTIIGIANVLIGPVTIGNNVMLAQNIVISGLNHGYEDISLSPRLQKEVRRPISVADDVWIGANSVVTAGVHIGRHCVVGAGSVVTKNIPDYCVVAGNPAKIIKQYNHQTQSWERI